MKTLSELTHLSVMEIKRDEGGPTEGRWVHNKLSRAKIRAMKREHGAAWIWEVNAGEDRPVAQEYKSGMVYNFTGAFVTSRYDAELERLIRERLATPYTGTANDWKWLDRIYKRLDEVKPCVMLFWV